MPKRRNQCRRICTQCKKSQPPVIDPKPQWPSDGEPIQPLGLRIGMRIDWFDRGALASCACRIAKEATPGSTPKPSDFHI